MALFTAGDELLAVYERFGAAQTLQDLQAECVTVLSELGEYHFAVGLFEPRKPQEQRVLAIDYPKAWIDHYFANQYLEIDPTVTSATHRAAPYDWDFPAALASDAAPLFRDVYDMGVRSGLTVPIHRPGGAAFVASFAAGADSEPRNRPLLTSIAVQFHEHFTRLETQAREAPPKLTARERDCLTWVARGKTSWEIGEILAVSERTVNFHLQNAFDKLGCSGRTMAVVRAITLGAINP